MFKNSTLNNISILFFSFLMLLVVINFFTTNNYGKANSQVIKMFDQHHYILDFHELHSIVKGKKITNYLFIDLRNEADFTTGHLPEAILIPFDELLQKKHLKILTENKDKTPVLYADHEATAHIARMLLLSKGIDSELRVLAGNYEKAVEYVLSDFKPAYAGYKDEKARFDYRRFMPANASSSGKTQQSSPGSIPQIQKQTLSVQGGC